MNIIKLNQMLNIYMDMGSFFFNLYPNILQLLILSNMVFFLGILGIVFNKRNFLLTMLFIEVMYVGIFSYLITSSMFLNSPTGQIYALLILMTAACESAMGLGLLLLLFSNLNTINFENFTELRG